jgi:hypothetical protein
MMRLLLAATIVFVTHAGVPAIDVPQVSPAPVAVFFDDFNGPDVNRAHWNVIVTGRVVNNEQQAYVDSTDTIRIVHGAEADGAENGALAIRPQFRSGFMTPEGRSFDFISGRLESRGKAEFTHGTVAARIKLPAGAGLWPAFWMLGTGRWPDTGELDIMENVGDASWTNVALHGPGYSGNTPLVARRAFPAPADATGWHVYMVEWTPDGFVFSVDGDAFYRPSRADVAARFPELRCRGEVGDDRRGDAATRGEGAGDRHTARPARGHEVVEDLVRGRLVEDPAVAVLQEVVLERFQFDARLIGHVGDADLAKVRQTRLGTHGGELRTADLDLVVAFGARIGKRLERDGHADHSSPHIEVDFRRWPM